MTQLNHIIYSDDEGVFVTTSTLDGRPGITTGTERFNTPAEALAYIASNNLI